MQKKKRKKVKDYKRQKDNILIYEMFQRGLFI